MAHQVNSSLLAVETPATLPGVFNACIPNHLGEVRQGTAIELHDKYEDANKRIASVIYSTESIMDGIGEVVAFSARMDSGRKADRAYRLIKGRRIRDVKMVIDQAQTVERLILVGPNPTVDILTNPDPARKPVAKVTPIMKPEKIVTKVNRQARTGDHVVYLMFNCIDALLYVGITRNGMKRMVQHERDKPWFSQVARIEIERYDNLLHAARREKKLIEKFAPLYNVTHNLGREVTA